MNILVGLTEPGVGESLVAEFEFLSGGAIARWLILVAFIVAVTSLLIWASALGGRTVRRFVDDVGRRTKRIEAGVRYVVIVVAAILILGPLLRRIPMITLALLAILTFLATRAVPNLLRDALVGVGLARRRLFREGDTIEIDKIRGHVSEIGNLRTTLVRSDGSKVLLPNRRFSEGDFAIAGSAGAEHVRIMLAVPVTTSAIKATRAALLASPYRLTGGMVQVTPRGSDEIEIELETWVTEGTDAVADVLEHSVREQVSLAQERAEAQHAEQNPGQLQPVTAGVK